MTLIDEKIHLTVISQLVGFHRVIGRFCRGSTLRLRRKLVF
jgi:hypothetical protein